MSKYVDLVWIAENPGIGVYEAPRWSVKAGDVVLLTATLGGEDFDTYREVDACVTVSEGSDVYEFIKAVNGGYIDKVKAVYNKAPTKGDEE